ncbi:MAG: hypothetical protein ABI625_17165 [bacterium]
MSLRANRIALVAIVLLGTSSQLTRAQTVDSVHKWSIFAGSDARAYPTDALLSNYELGGTGDFRLEAFPLPLRATLTFGQLGQALGGSGIKFGGVSLDAIGRPVPKFLGMQPYLLGGLGVATRAPYSGIVQGYSVADAPQPASVGMPYRVERHNWAFVEVGGGLEVSRMFVQWKATSSVTSLFGIRAPLSIGIRF